MRRRDGIVVISIQYHNIKHIKKSSDNCQKIKENYWPRVRKSSLINQPNFTNFTSIAGEIDQYATQKMSQDYIKKM